MSQEDQTTFLRLERELEDFPLPFVSFSMIGGLAAPSEIASSSVDRAALAACVVLMSELVMDRAVSALLLVLASELVDATGGLVDDDSLKEKDEEE